MSAHVVSISHFSDLLCIWAYVAQARVEELLRKFPEQVRIEYHFVPVFGDVGGKIGARWSGRGGFEGYAAHVREVAAPFDHVDLHADVWKRVAPKSSLAPHAFVKAAALLEADGAISGERDARYEGRTTVEELAWRLRLAFFREARDIGRTDVLTAIAAELDLPTEPLHGHLEDGSALAALAADHETCARHGVDGSPTFLLNEGRQRLYGNVGYRVIEANVLELLRDDRDSASWC